MHTMAAKKIISAATLAFLLSAGAVAAQTTNPTSTDTLGTVQTTDTTSGSSTPGTPNTGAGGDVAGNALLLSSSALVALAGILYVLTRRPREI